jgi:hypothetical protein
MNFEILPLSKFPLPSVKMMNFSHLLPQRMLSKPPILSLILGTVALNSLFLPTIAVASPSNNAEPKSGVVKQMIMGDLLCYVDLQDAKGKPYHLGADFAVCTKTRRFLGKKVRVSYKKMRVNDCQSAEPCGKTKMQRVIYKMQVIK